MGKKKKKASFKSDSEDDDISTDENSPESSHLSNCPHVGKAVNVATLKKALKAAWIRVGNCGACAKDKRQNIKAAGKNAYVKTVGQQVKNPELASDIWMCLKCGVQSCGPENLKTNSEVGHTICHVKTPRSELHCIFVNVKSWKIYCFECQDDLYIDSYKKLREAVEMVKRVAEVKKVVEPVKKSIMTKSPSTTFNNAEAVKVQKARGLTNLGNTCFFNSVMQCLTQSHPLTKVLDQHCQKGAPFCTPYLELKSTETNHGDNTSLQDSGLSTATSSSLEDTIDEQHANDTIKAFSMQLNEAGPVTLALAAFLKDMHSVGKPGAVNPGHLFGQVCRRSPQFRGFQQQDSHELLRHLMESLRTEEVKRQKSVILKQFGLSEKTDPKTVSQRIKRKLQALGRYSNFTLIDKIFGGQLVSTIVCEQCHNSSQIYEPFLDLSLPLIEEKPQRPGKVKNEDETNEISCFAGFRKNKREETEADGNKQLSKKERQKQKAAARKAKKMAQKQGNVLKLDEVKPEEVKDETKEDEKETKEEIEEKMNEDDEVKEIKLKNSEAKQNINRFEALQNTKNSQQTKRILDGSEEDDEDGFSVDEDDDWEWDYDDGNEAKNTDEKEEELISDYIETDAATLEEEETVPKVSLNPLPPERLKMASEEREKSSEKTTEESAEDEGDIEDNVEEFRLTDPNLLRHLKPFKPDPQRLDPHMEALCRKVRKLSVSMADPDAETETKQYDFDEEKHQTRLQNDWVARSLTSIAPRYHAKSGECSIYSCLAQFTAPELLTGQNKWACDKCTRIQQEMTPESDCSENNSTKMVYSNASKQLLIFCPPAVLTIHLKRFQQTMFNLRKVNKHVTFPMTLDLAPFCSSTSLSMPTVSFSNNEILYTLFGVVEHSGRLQGGHYTAFVKLRPSQLTENLSKFYSCPTARNEEIFNLLAEIEKKNQSQNVEEEVQSEIPGKWYHISDQSVSEVTEEKMSRFFANLFAKAKQSDAAVMTRYREKQAEMASKMHEKIKNPSNKEIFKAAIGYYEDPSPKKMNEKIYKKMPKVNPGAVDPTSGDNSFGRLHQLKVLWTVMFAGFGFIAYTKYQERKSRISRSKKIQTPLFKAKGFKLARYKNCIILEDAVKNGLVESIEKFQLRDSDVICASFPKSGTTWLQQVVYLLMHPDEDGSQKEGNVRDTLEHRVPYIEYPYPGLNEISKRKDPRIIKTHLPQHLLPTNGKGKVIYIVRDPKDVMVSYYFFARMLTQMSFEGNLEDFALQMMQDRVPYGPYFDHLVGFKMAAQAEDQRYLIVKYENMKKDPKTAIKEIAEFLDIKTSEELLTKIEKETSFDKMKSNPVTNYQHWDEWGLRNPEESEFMRKGQVGDHKNHFSPELQDSVSKWVQTNVENYPMIKSLV